MKSNQKNVRFSVLLSGVLVLSLVFSEALASPNASPGASGAPASAAPVVPPAVSISNVNTPPNVSSATANNAAVVSAAISANASHVLLNSAAVNFSKPATGGAISAFPSPITSLSAGAGTTPRIVVQPSSSVTSTLPITSFGNGLGISPPPNGEIPEALSFTADAAGNVSAGGKTPLQFVLADSPSAAQKKGEVLKNKASKDKVPDPAKNNFQLLPTEKLREYSPAKALVRDYNAYIEWFNRIGANPSAHINPKNAIE